MRGALYYLRESCLVNSIVLQTWEAAHGCRRDLVIGITGPDGFSAHAWLDGDPVPTDDDIGLDASVLPAEPGRSGRTASEARGPGRHDASGEGADAPFQELLRRAAPHYPRLRSTRAR